MYKGNVLVFRSFVLCSLLFAAGSSTWSVPAAPYPLELTNIRQGLGPQNRLSRAYPGLEYNIRAAVIGGAFPYTFSLAKAPAGMSINSRTGEITWSSPQVDSSPTITVVDSAGTEVSATWTIKVTANGFRFIDATNGKTAQGNGCEADCGLGTMTKPWRTVRDLFLKGSAGDFVYFRNGTYVVTDLPRVRPGAPWERVEFAEKQNPVVWMAQPGEAPVIDFAFKPGVEAGPLIRFTGENVYVDGFETINSHLIAFQFVSGGASGATFRRLRMHAHGPGIDGSNAAFILTTTHPRPTDYTVIQDSEFWDVTGDSVTIKIYAQRKLLIEDTVHHHATVAIELKDDVRQFTVRGNRFYDVVKTGIGGNMHETGTHGEILFNNVRAGLALDLNQNGMAGPIHVYRNTFVGRVQVRNTDGADGPFYLTNNVIVSADPGDRIHREQVTDPSRIVLSDNLAASPSREIVDANGDLTIGYSRYLGTHGHERTSASPPAKRFP